MIKNFTKLLAFIGFTAMLSLTSCKKKCILNDDFNGGEILTEVSIYPNSGYLTPNMTVNDYHITASHQYASQYKTSTDGGVTKVDANYGKYSILCYPITTTCNASFDRSVSIDDVNGVVVYKITATECSNCKEKRFFENYVAIRAIPDSYTVLYDVELITK